jgi:hypothetical protein
MVAAPRQPHMRIDRVDDRQQRQRHEDGDDRQAQHVAQAPREVQEQGTRHDDGHDPSHRLQGRSGKADRSISIRIGGATVAGGHQGHGLLPQQTGDAVDRDRQDHRSEDERQQRVMQGDPAHTSCRQVGV